MKVAIFLLILLMIGIASATTTTFYPPTTAADGRISNITEQTYANARAAITGTIDTTGSSGLLNIAGVSFVASANSTDSLVRFFSCYDTSSIGSSSTITSGVWAVEGEAGGLSTAGPFNFSITGYTPATPATLQATDYDTFGDTLLSDTYINITNWKVGRNEFTLNADGRTAINKSGYTCIALRFKDDILNTQSEITDNSSSASYVRGYDSSITTVAMKPNLTVVYTTSGAYNVTFTSNVTPPITPRTNVQFTDTSGIVGTTGRVWAYKDYSGYTTDGYTLPINPVWNNFSSGNNIAPVYAWGAGNWSIRLDVYNGTNTTTSEGYYWLNVSAGRSDNISAPAGYQFYPSDSVWNMNISNTTTFPCSTYSSTWIAGLKAVSPAPAPYYIHYTIAADYGNGGQMQKFFINDTITKQFTTNYPGNDYNTRHYPDWASIPIPDDIAVQTNSSDTTSDLIDTEHSIVYQLYQVTKAANGTFAASTSIWNYSEYCYRFSGYANGTDNGCRWMGNEYQVQDTANVYTRRNETIPWYFGPSMSGLPWFQSLVSREELATGYINHTLYVTTYRLNGTQTYPALASGYWGLPSNICWSNHCPPAGARVRLNASYNITNISGTRARIVATTLKNYGAWLGENGGYYPIHIMTYNNTASPWNATENSDLSGLNALKLDDFEFVDISGVVINPFSMKVNITSSPAYSPSFTKSKTVIRIPSNVTFTDTTSGSPGAWNWSFGDGRYSELQNPTHRYTRPGRFNVSLTTYGGIAYANVIVIGGSSEQKLTPFSTQNSVSCEDMTYTASRELTETERIMTDEKIAGVCGI